MRVSSNVAAGSLLLVGVLSLLFSVMLAEFEYPGYSVRSNYVSDLGATCTAGRCITYAPSSWIFNTGVILTGIFVVAGTLFLYLSFKSRLLSTFLVVAGAAAVGVGLFPESAGAIHGYLADIAFLSMGLAALLSARVVVLPMKVVSLVLGGLTIVFAVLYEEGVFLSFGPGGMERLVLYPTLFWGLVFGGYILGHRQEKPRQ